MNNFENYTMDIFLEYMVKRKYTAKEYIKIAGFVVLFLALAVLAFVGNFIFPFFGQLMMLIFAGALYFGYVMVTRQSVEFEYSLTNSYLDIDKIIAKRRRVDVIDFDVKEIDEMRKLNLQTYKNDSLKTIILGNIDQSAYYIIGRDNDDNKVRVIFNPPTKMVESIKKFAKGKVID